MQYICELYFDKAKGDRQALIEWALQSLGFIPNIMSIYVTMDEMYEEVSYNKDLLFSILSREGDSGVEIAEHVYNENASNPWYRLSKVEGNFFCIKWGNENFDFLISKNIFHFLKMSGFMAGYIYEAEDAFNQTNKTKAASSSKADHYPGRFKYVCGMKFMAAPLMWFGESFFKIIDKNKLLEFEGASLEGSLDVVEINLFDFYDSPSKIENREKQKNFWLFFDLDKIVSKFEEENAIDAVQSLKDFLAKNQSRKSK